MSLPEDLCYNPETDEILMDFFENYYMNQQNMITFDIE